MASEAGDVFTKWLKTKLRELNTDESVFSAYIIGILESDDPIDEKTTALEEILSEIIDNTQLQNVIKDINDNWDNSRPKEDETKKEVIDVDTKLAKLLENNCIATTVQRQQYTEEELRIRQQILAQYSQVELDDGDDDADAGPVAAGGSIATNSSSTTSTNVSNVEKNDPLMAKNTNASDVAQLAKERREQAKLDSKAKKDKDKEDREKQKQLREEKKEKRKTVKGERRR